MLRPILSIPTNLGKMFSRSHQASTAELCRFSGKMAFIQSERFDILRDFDQSSKPAFDPREKSTRAKAKFQSKVGFPMPIGRSNVMRWRLYDRST